MINILQNKMKALFVSLAVIVLALFIGFLTARSSAIPYEGEATQPSPVPAFNVYTGVPDVGNESEFFYGKVDGSTADSVKDVRANCETGTRFALRIYVHNGASQHNNGDGNGPSVAKDTKVKVVVPGSEASSFVPEATISASNASSISDTLTITCTNGKKVTMKYVAGTAQQYNPLSGVQAVSDSIVTSGAPIGTFSPNGDLWGCWDQRVWVRLIVEVTEVPKVFVPAVCDALLYTLLASNQVRIDDVRYTLNDATLNNITLSYGDGTTETVTAGQFPRQPHTYAQEGTYTLRATLNTTFRGQPSSVTSENCEKKIKIEKKLSPKFDCESFKLVMNGRTANVSFVPTASNGATFKDATIKYVADDKEVNSVTTDKLTDGKVVSTYTFADNVVNVDANATVRFNVGTGKKMVVKEVKCSGEAVLGSTTPPTTLPDTGAGSTLAAILVAVSAIGAFAHRKFTLNR